MSSDLLIQLSDTGADLALEAGDLAGDPGLVSDVLVSLFSDSRAGEEDSIPDGTTNRRGWWGEPLGVPFGSLVWLLSSSKITGATMDSIRAYAESALSWLVTYGVAEDVEVAVSRGDVERVDLQIRITRGSATRWAHLWEAVESQDFTSDRLRVQLITA